MLTCKQLTKQKKVLKKLKDYTNIETKGTVPWDTKLHDQKRTHFTKSKKLLTNSY